MPSLVVDELNSKLQMKLKERYPNKKELIDELKYKALDKHSVVIDNELNSKIRFKIDDYKDSMEFLFYLKNSQKPIEIENYESEQMFKDIPLEESDVYKTILDEEKPETSIIMSAAPFTEKDRLNIMIKVEGEFKRLELSRKANDSKEEMKYLFEGEFLIISVLVEKEVKYMQWSFKHLFNEKHTHVNILEIINTYKMLIALASGEIYTTSKKKLSSDSLSKNKSIIESLKKDLKLFEIIYDFQKVFKKQFEISTPFNLETILESVKLYFLLYKQKLILEEKHLEGLFIKTDNFNGEDIEDKKFSLIQEENSEKSIFNHKISYTLYQCYYQINFLSYEQLNETDIKLKLNPDESIAIINKGLFNNTNQPLNLEEIAFEEAETLNTLIDKYKPNENG
ncbi:hypothetical protein BE24_12235 [Staphylococcus xylosus]|nr:hypothetical protein BE24_12235 [Staphylococcus xylosus]